MNMLVIDNEVIISAADHSRGALNALGMAGWSAGIISMLLLDLTIYAQHFFFHSNIRMGTATDRLMRLCPGCWHCPSAKSLER